MNKTNSSWLKTFSIGFSIISFGITIAIAGYFVLTTKQNKTPNQPSPTPLPSETSMKEDDRTANWKTYSNNKYSFSFRYPGTWTLTSSESERYEPRIDLQHERTSLTIYLTKFNSGLESIPIIRKETIKTGDKSITFNYYYATVVKSLSGYSDLSLPENTLPFYMVNFHLDDRHKDSDLLIIKQILSAFRFIE